MVPAAIPWDAIAAIAALVAIGVAVGVAWWQVRVSRPRSRLGIVAYRDPSDRITVVVDNERGTQAIRVRSVCLVEADGTTEVPASSNFTAPVDIAAGGSETWSFDLYEALADVQVRVDTGRRPHFATPTPLEESLIDDEDGP
jgi:hypothetical protein